MKSFISLCVLLLTGVFAHALEVSGVDYAAKSDSFYRFTMTFSGYISISNCTYDVKNEVFKFPLHSYKERSYLEISAAGKDFFKAISSAASRGRDFNNANKSYKEPSPAVTFNKLKSEKRIYNAEVVFDGELKLVYGIEKRTSVNNKIFYMVRKPKNVIFADKSFETYVKSFILAQGKERGYLISYDDGKENKKSKRKSKVKQSELTR